MAFFLYKRFTDIIDDQYLAGYGCLSKKEGCTILACNGRICVRMLIESLQYLCITGICQKHVPAFFIVKPSKL
jgi:hypothetical protein